MKDQTRALVAGGLFTGGILLLLVAVWIESAYVTGYPVFPRSWVWLEHPVAAVMFLGAAVGIVLGVGAAALTHLFPGAGRYFAAGATVGAGLPLLLVGIWLLSAGDYPIIPGSVAFLQEGLGVFLLLSGGGAVLYAWASLNPSAPWGIPQ